MDLNFKQKIVIAIIGGLFLVLSAYISKSDGQFSSSSNHSIVSNGNNIAISNGGNASSTSNINIVDQRVAATNGSIAVSGNGNVNINQNSNNSSDVSIKINGQEFNQ